MPSLAQLDQAVREFIAENSNDVVTVVVDASFGHRIDPSELPTFEGAESAGEVISPQRHTRLQTALVVITLVSVAALIALGYYVLTFVVA